MKQWIAAMTLVLAPLSASSAVIYEGSLDDGAVYNGSLESESGWSESNGSWVDFWSFEGAAGETISLFAGSETTDVAFSVYTGTPDEFSQPSFFNNAGDWDLFSLETTSSTVGDESLLDFILPESGTFTLALGGEVAPYLSTGSGPWTYDVQLTRAAAVSAPGSLALLSLGLLGLGALRARQA